MPDETYETRMVIHGGRRDVELIYAPSETDDVTAVWIPGERLLYGSAAVIRSIPNVGTPLRTIRDPVRWAETLERLYALPPAFSFPNSATPFPMKRRSANACCCPQKFCAGCGRKSSIA